MYVYFNPNPARNIVGDCVIRACVKLLNLSWVEVYMGICTEGASMYDMPSSNAVWSSYLQKKGCKRCIIPNTCPECYTVKDFCLDFPRGRYLLATGSHAIAVVNGDYYDTWDSGDEIPAFYWTKGD